MSRPESLELSRVDRNERNELYVLVDEYLRELSAHRERPAGPIDAASYTYLPLYWEEPGRHPFFIRDRDSCIGFVLVREVEAERIIEMSDFYIQPESRRAGSGRAALAEIWHRFPGTWRLQVHPLNPNGSAFWPQVIGEFASGRIDSREVTEEDGRRLEFTFEIPTT